MRLNHSDVVLDYEGNPLMDGDHKVQFRDLVMMAFNVLDPHDGAETKAKIFGASQKFYRGKFAKLTVDEAALVKEKAAKALSPIAYGRLCEWLEGEAPFVATDAEDDDLTDEA